MTGEETLSLISSFKELPDPRVEGRCDHRLIDIIVVAVCGVIAGAESWVDIESFGKAKQDWLSTFLELPNGIPSHDTFGRFFAALDGEAFQQAFSRWVQSVFEVSRGEVVAIDGKTVRRSHDCTIGKDAIHIVNAWATTNGIALGQWKTDASSNEIMAIPPLLRQLNVSGCIVTLDAMGAQKTIARAIRDEQADYVLRIKDNQAQLHQDLQDWFAYADQVNFEEMSHRYAETVNKGHGRIEIRRCWVIDDPLAFDYIRHFEGWADLNSMVRVQRERRVADTIQQQTAYYISSLEAVDAHTLLAATRYHWAVENSLHWVLDVVFREDQSRIRAGHAAHNMAILRQMALNVIKKDTSQGSIRTKRYKAALDTAFLDQLLDRF